MSAPSLPPQFDVSPREKRLIADRAKIRAEFRAEFIKAKTSPYRHGSGGYIFDPALQRWASMRSQQWYYFKPNPKTGIFSALVFLSCIGFGHWLKVRRDARDRDYRTGKVAYRDRDFKFM